MQRNDIKIRTHDTFSFVAKRRKRRAAAAAEIYCIQLSTIIYLIFVLEQMRWNVAQNRFSLSLFLIYARRTVQIVCMFFNRNLLRALLYYFSTFVNENGNRKLNWNGFSHGKKEKESENCKRAKREIDT